MFAETSIKFIHLKSTDYHLSLLKTFYEKVFFPAVTNPNEAPTLKQIIYSLDRRTQGWTKDNNFQIILIIDNEKLIAGAIANYFVQTNTGIIEFLVVAKKRQFQEVGKELIRSVENALIIDASTYLKKKIDYIICKMHDPLKTRDQDDLVAAKILDHWGYRYVDFPYVQPALSEDRKPSHDLALVVKCPKDRELDKIPSEKLKLILYEYLRLGLHMKHPDKCQEYNDMVAYLDKITYAPVESIDTYIKTAKLK